MRSTHFFEKLILAIGLMALTACNSLLDWEDTRPCGNGQVASDEECDDGNVRDGDGCSSRCEIEYAFTKKVDVLLVVDYSADMADYHANLMERVPDLMSWLKIVRGGLPDLHVGVTTMDVGAMGNMAPNCTENGDDGRLQKHDCPNLPDHHYIVDIAPMGCTIAQAQRPGEELQCTGHTCSDANCSTQTQPGLGLEPSNLKLVTDGHGCPRCRNYVVDDLQGVLSCLMDRPSNFCGWEQPLEAMMRALTRSHPENFSFRRPDAHLVVLFLTSEDDCTAATPDLFNPEALSLGDYTGFRCWQWGVRCDQAWNLDSQNLIESYSGCRPRTEGEGGKLRNVSNYVNELRQVVNSGEKRYFIQTIALAGPHETDLRVEFQNGRWEVSRIDGTDVFPNLRLFDFTWRMSVLAADMQWCFFSLLSESWEAPLVHLGQRLRAVIERSMPPP
jgi:cysteine-rich repeat protein